MAHRPWYIPASRREMLVPFLDWFKEYDLRALRADLAAGFVVAVVLIPQSMAYALLAGLPPVTGFYAGIVGAVAASLWGSTRVLSTGPVAIVSFLVMSTLVPLAEPQSPEYIALAAALALLSGLMLFALGVFRLGSLMRYIPHSVVIGFSSAAAIIIAATQLPALFGFSAAPQEYMLASFMSVARHVPEAHIPTITIGVLSLLALLVCKRFFPRLPAALLVLAGATLLSFALGFDELGIGVVGMLSASLPTPDFSALTMIASLALITKAMVIALVGFVSTYAVAQSFQGAARRSFDVDQELIGQGMANMLSGLFRGFPVAGSFSRTAINAEAGAHSGMASIFAALVIFFALLALAPVLAFIPLATLAAIIIASVLDLIEVRSIRAMYRLSRTDGVVAGLTFSVALLVKPDDAVMIGVIAALALFIRRIVRVKVRVLGIEPGWNILQGIETGGTVETFPGVLMVRAETSAFYGNIEVVIRRIDAEISRAETEGTLVKALVLDCSSISYMDLAGAETILEYIRKLREEGIDTYAIYIHPSIYGLFSRMKVLDEIGIFHNIAEMRATLGLEVKEPAPESAGHGQSILS